MNTKNSLNALGVHYIPTEETKILDGGSAIHREVILKAIDQGDKIRIPVEITPELAKEFLKRNTSNIRAMNKKRVNEELAPQIAAGEWVPLNAEIAFDGQGLLKNGQHTCAAVVKADYPIQAWVECGITRQREMVMDNCSPRRTHHAIQGMDQYGQAALTAMLELGTVGKVDTSGFAMSRHWEKFGEKVSTVLGILGEFSDGKRPMGTASFHGALVAAMVNGVTETDIRRFVDEAYGTNMTWPQAANMVRNLGTAHYKGYAAKQKRRQYNLTLMVLENYLLQDTSMAAPKTPEVDKYVAQVKWNVSA